MVAYLRTNVRNLKDLSGLAAFRDDNWKVNMKTKTICHFEQSEKSDLIEEKTGVLQCWSIRERIEAEDRRHEAGRFWILNLFRISNFGFFITYC